MEACRALKEYAMYVERVRTYAKQMSLAEAIKVSIYEYDEELHFRTLYEEGREGRLDDLKRATQDKAYQEQLMIELLPEEMRNMPIS